VFITGRRKDALDAAAAELGKNNVTAIQVDVANLSDIDRLYDAAASANGKSLSAL